MNCLAVEAKNVNTNGIKRDILSTIHETYQQVMTKRSQTEEQNFQLPKEN